MRSHAFHADFFGKIRSVFQILHPPRAIGDRHETDRVIAVDEVPRGGYLPAAPERGDFHARFFYDFANARRVFVCKFAHIPAAELTGGQAVLFHVFKCRFQLAEPLHFVREVYHSAEFYHIFSPCCEILFFILQIPP